MKNFLPALLLTIVFVSPLAAQAESGGDEVDESSPASQVEVPLMNICHINQHDNKFVVEYFNINKDYDSYASASSRDEAEQAKASCENMTNSLDRNLHGDD